MIIVAGALTIDPDERDAYLRGCVDVVAAARQAPGCLDYALSPDLVEPGRINVHERWESRDDLDRFRGSGPSEEQAAQLREIAVAEYTVV